MAMSKLYSSRVVADEYRTPWSRGAVINSQDAVTMQEKAETTSICFMMCRRRKYSRMVGEGGRECPLGDMGKKTNSSTLRSGPTLRGTKWGRQKKMHLSCLKVVAAVRSVLYDHKPWWYQRAPLSRLKARATKVSRNSALVRFRWGAIGEGAAA